MFVVIYYCPVCRLHHIDIAIEFVNAEPYHRTSDGTLHAVTKSGRHWVN